MMVSKRNLLFQGLIFRFHVKLQGCNIFGTFSFRIQLTQIQDPPKKFRVSRWRLRSPEKFYALVLRQDANEFQWPAEQEVRHVGFNQTPVRWFQVFVVFTPNFGEDEPILTSKFFEGVGSTTN